MEAKESSDVCLKSIMFPKPIFFNYGKVFYTLFTPKTNQDHTSSFFLPFLLTNRYSKILKKLGWRGKKGDEGRKMEGKKERNKRREEKLYLEEGLWAPKLDLHP